MDPAAAAAVCRDTAGEEDEEWIPCELCDTMVRFRDFQSHMDECSRSRSNMFDAAAMFAMFDGRGNDDSEQDDDDDDDDDDEDGDGGHRRLGVGIAGSGMHGMMLAFASASVAGSPMFVSVQNPSEIMGEYEVNSMIAELLGNVQRGVPDADAALVPVTEVQTTYTDVDKCPICYESLLDIAIGDAPAAIVRTARCNHSFCDVCIRTWLAQHATCPVCMTDLGAEYAATSSGIHDEDGGGSSSDDGGAGSSSSSSGSEEDGGGSSNEEGGEDGGEDGGTSCCEDILEVGLHHAR